MNPEKINKPAASIEPKVYGLRSGGVLPPPTRIKALAFDLDGTLLAPGAVLSERTIRAIRACAAKGLRVIIATGRAAPAAEKFRAALGVSGPMVYHNGALVADMPEIGPGTPLEDSVKKAKILHSVLLNKEAVNFCVDISRAMGVYFQVFSERAGGNDPVLMTETEAPERKVYFDHTGLLAEIVDMKEILNEKDFKGCTKGMYIAEDPVQEKLRPRLEEGLGNSVYLARTKSNFLEIMDARVSKGKGLAVALEKMGIRKEETMAFGDEENDLSLFEAASFSVAPANARDIVRAAADFTALSNAEDGVAVFLENYFSL